MPTAARFAEPGVSRSARADLTAWIGRPGRGRFRVGFGVLFGPGARR